MDRKVYNKLIRDKIPEIIKYSKASAKVRVLSKTKYKEALKRKLA